MAIDLRLRPPYKSFLSLHVYTDPIEHSIPSPGFEIEISPSVKARSMDLMFQEMDEAGITHGVLPGRNAIPPYHGHEQEDVYELVERYPDRFIGLPNINPIDRKAAYREIDRAASTPGIPGVHLEPAWGNPPLHADDRLIFPIYERCEDKQLVVAISGGGWIGPDYDYVNPVDIQRVAKAFQSLKIIVCHGGWPWIDVMLGVAYSCPNVYVSPDMYFTMEGIVGMERYALAANSYLADRLLFGTAYPVRSFRQSLKRFHEYPFRDAGVKEKVLTTNAEKVFGLKL